MLKKLFYLVLLVPFLSYSQYSISGKFTPKTEGFSWIILYQINELKQVYIERATLTEDGKFNLKIPEGSEKGVYRLMFSLEENGFIDVLFNNENIEVEFNPLHPNETLRFITSEENKIYANYWNEIIPIQNKLDSIQISFFKLEDEKKRKKAQEFYKKELLKLNHIQKTFNKKSKGKLAHSFIKNEQKYYANYLLKTPQEFLDNEKENFYNYINFSDKNIRKSTLLTEKIISYIFYLNASDDAKMQTILFQEAIDKTMLKTKDNEAVKSKIIYTLLYTFAQIEDLQIVNYILKNYYEKLNESYKNKTTIEEIKEKVRLAIGAKAPNFKWKDGKKTNTLHNLPLENNYIIAFWSTDCSHCLEEMPKLYQATKNLEKVKVIAYAIEKDELGFNYYTQNFTKWINVLGLNKWNNKVAKSYNITATPTYFILNENKKIIAKPYAIKDVLTFIKTLKK